MLHSKTDDSILMRCHLNATMEPIHTSFLDLPTILTEEMQVNPRQNLILVIVGILFAGFLLVVPLLAGH